MEEKIIKINILTPINPGGPYCWGLNLATQLNKRGFSAKHLHDMLKLARSSFYCDADVVHATVPVSFRFWRKPLILTAHGDYRLETKFWRFMSPIALKKATMVTSPSYFLKERLNLTNARVIPNAVFPQNFNTISHSEKETLNLVTVMPMYFAQKTKGIFSIFQNLEKIQSMTNKKINYTLVGGGKYLNLLESEAKKYKINVTFTGMSPNPRQHLENSDIFLYYSYFDNFPIVILEAMACGLPVLTNTVGAVNEIIKDGDDGFVAENDSQYIEYLLHLVNNVEVRQAIGRNARKTVEARFDWEKVIGEYISIYKQLS